MFLSLIFTFVFTDESNKKKCDFVINKQIAMPDDDELLRICLIRENV